MLADLNNVQQTDISDIHEHCISFNISYLISFLVASGLNYFCNPGVKFT